MSRSRAKGTSWESAVVTHLRANGVPHAERRALNGAKDRGDIAGIPGVAIECKSAARVELAAWLDEAETERANDGADVGVVWIKRRGKTSPGAGFVIMSGDQLLRLLAAAGYTAATTSGAPAPVRRSRAQEDLPEGVMTTPTPSPDVRELAARTLHSAFPVWSPATGTFPCNGDHEDLGEGRFTCSVADAVLAAVSPVIRRQSLDEAESAIFQAGLCNEGTPYDSLSGAILVVRGLQLRTAAAAIARHAHPEEGK